MARCARGLRRGAVTSICLSGSAFRWAWVVFCAFASPSHDNERAATKTKGEIVARNHRLITRCTAPHPADLVFYGRVHVAMVTEVHTDGTYDEIEAAPQTLFVAEHRKKRWLPHDVGRFLR